MPTNPFAPPDSPVADIPALPHDAEVAFELKYRDLVLFNWAHLLMSPFVQAIFLLATFGVFGPMMAGGRFAEGLAHAATLYLVVWALQLGAVALNLLSRRNRTLLTAQRVRVDTGGYHQHNRFGHTTRFWPGVERVVSRPGFIAFYVSQTGAQLVPDRAFAHRAQRDEFLRFAQEQVRKAAAWESARQKAP